MRRCQRCGRKTRRNYNICDACQKRKERTGSYSLRACKRHKHNCRCNVRYRT